MKDSDTRLLSRHWVALTCPHVLAVMLVGCGSDLQLREQDLKELLLAYTNTALVMHHMENKTVGDFSQIEPQLQRSEALIKRVRDGKYEIIWNIPKNAMLSDDPRTKQVLVVYEKQVATKGGLGILGNGDVVEISAAELDELLKKTEKIGTELRAEIAAPQ